MKRIILLILILSTQFIHSQALHGNGVRIKNLAVSSGTDHIITIDANGLLNRSTVTLSALPIGGPFLQLSGGTLTGNLQINLSSDTGGYTRYANNMGSFQVGMTGATTGDFLIYDNSNAESVFTYNSSGGVFHNNTTFNENIYTAGIVIDPALTTTNIASSILTVKNASTTASTNVTQFIDVSRNNTTDTSTGETTALVSRVVNSSSNVNDGIYGLQAIGRKTGSGNSTFNYGLLSTADQQGSGNIDFLNSSVLRTNITGSGVTTVDFNRGIGMDLNINNSNATVNNAQAIHSSIQMDAGTIGTVSNLFLDFDGTGATVTGDLAYMIINNDVLPTVNGNSYSIKSNSTLPSEFAGLVSTTQTNTQIDAASGDALVPKRWVQANGSETHGTFTPTLVDAGGGATYTIGTSTGNYIKTPNMVHFSIVLSNISTTGTPSGILQMNGLPFDQDFANIYNVIVQGGNVSFSSIQGDSFGSSSIVFRTSSTDSTTNNAGFYSSVTFISGEIEISGTYFTGF